MNPLEANQPRILLESNTHDQSQLETPENRFDEIRKLDRGGFSDIFLVYDNFMRKDVAVKVIEATDQLNRRFPIEPSENGLNTSALAALEEFQIMSEINHPNVMQVFQYGVVGDEANKRAIIIMEYIKGDTFWSKSFRELPLLEKLEALSQGALAIDTIHEHGIIHGDVKAGSFLLEEESKRTVLYDFGLAQDLDSVGDSLPNDIQIGTPGYYELKYPSISKASDKYAFVVTVFNRLYGEFPFEKMGMFKRHSTGFISHKEQMRYMTERVGDSKYLHKFSENRNLKKLFTKDVCDALDGFFEKYLCTEDDQPIRLVDDDDLKCHSIVDELQKILSP